MKGSEIELQKLVSQEARAVTGCFRTSNLGALMAESRIRPAVAQLGNDSDDLRRGCSASYRPKEWWGHHQAWGEG